VCCVTISEACMRWSWHAVATWPTYHGIHLCYNGTRFPKRFKTTFICSSFFQVQTTWPYFALVMACSCNVATLQLLTAASAGVDCVTRMQLLGMPLLLFKMC
jgi:hypothetical protein